MTNIENQDIGEIDNNLRYKIDLLNKNLEYISNAYFSGEQIYPLWEAVYALITGQLLLAFFTQNPHSTRSGYGFFIPVIGIVFSLAWAKVISISHSHSVDRNKKMIDLQNDLEKEYNKVWRILGNSDFNFTKLGLKNQAEKSMYNSTWWWRKITPIGITIFWMLIFLLSIKDC